MKKRRIVSLLLAAAILAAALTGEDGTRDSLEPAARDRAV